MENEGFMIKLVATDMDGNLSRWRGAAWYETPRTVLKAKGFIFAVASGRRRSLKKLFADVRDEVIMKRHEKRTKTRCADHEAMTG